jgi:superfamily II DNA or RNA helicase
MLTITYNSTQAQIDSIDSPTLLKGLESLLSYQETKYLPSRFHQKTQTYCLLDNSLRFPTGLLPRVSGYLKTKHPTLKFQVIKSIPSVTPNLLDLPSEHLYPHQQEIIARALKVKRGVFQSPTGSGKSRIIAWILKHLPNERCIVTVPEKMLLLDMKKTLELYLAEEIGVVQAGTRNFQRVTVGIINSLANLKDREHLDLLNQTTVILYDEAHRVGENFYRRFAEKCPNADISIGISGTMWREGADSLVMEGVIGPLVLKVSELDLIKSGVITPPRLLTTKLKEPDLPNYTKWADAYQNGIVKNSIRNNYIVDLVKVYLQSPRPNPGIIFVLRHLHAEILANLYFLKTGEVIPILTGNSNLAERESLIKALETGETSFAIVTEIFNEGQNIPCLRVAINASGGKSRKRVLQQVGRLTRLHPSKQDCIFVDIEDSLPILDNNYKSRREAIRSTYGDCQRRLSPDELLTFAQQGFRN